MIAKGTTKEDFAGTGKELPCSMGTVLEVIVKENCPSGKWLVRNLQGHCKLSNEIFDKLFKIRAVVFQNQGVVHLRKFQGFSKQFKKKTY